MKIYRIRNLVLLNALLLAACSTDSHRESMHTAQPIPAAPTAVAPAAPDMHAIQATCDQLQQQFQTQLPAPILNLMHWQVSMEQNPLINQPSIVPVCQLHLSTDGATIEKLGLTPQFMNATLERLNWTQNAMAIAYAASSPTADRSVMVQDKQMAVIDYQYAPPAQACPNNQPISACKVVRKKWLYELNVAILAM